LEKLSDINSSEVDEMGWLGKRKKQKEFVEKNANSKKPPKTG